MTVSSHLTAILAAMLSAMLLLAGSIRAADNDTITDPAKGGPDFFVQGEYLGEVTDAPPEAKGKKVGAQVIALGDGKFHAVLYLGGLPGDGAKDVGRAKQADLVTEGGVVKFAKGNKGMTIAEGVMTVLDNGKPVATLKKHDRKNPALGAKPPASAVVLFDGKSADNFKNGKITTEGLLMADCESKQTFGDCSLHVEFRTPFMPKARGQGRGNSGVYVDSRYELQVLDSFGLSGENNECGGFYSIQKPSVNMCLPPLEWQAYDIDFTAARYDDHGKKTKNARVTVKHNGVTIHDDLELPRGTPGKLAEGPGAAPLYLQGHGNPVVYRNIWVVDKK